MVRSDIAFWLGWIGTGVALAMFLSQIDQAIKNLKGAQGSILNPTITIVNCSIWTAYGFCIEPQSWPVIISNGVAIPIAMFTAYTAVISKRKARLVVRPSA